MYSRIRIFVTSMKSIFVFSKLFANVFDIRKYSCIISVRTPQVHFIYYVLKFTVLLYSCYTLLNNDYRIFSNEWTSRTPTLSVRTCPRSYCPCHDNKQLTGPINKHVGIDLHVAPFTHGQLYVALSRCTSKSRIKALLPPAANKAANNKTINIVYTEVLLPPI